MIGLWSSGTVDFGAVAARMGAAGVPTDSRTETMRRANEDAAQLAAVRQQLAGPCADLRALPLADLLPARAGEAVAALDGIVGRLLQAQQAVLAYVGRLEADSRDLAAVAVQVSGEAAATQARMTAVANAIRGLAAQVAAVRARHAEEDRWDPFHIVSSLDGLIDDLVNQTSDKQAELARLMRTHSADMQLQQALLQVTVALAQATAAVDGASRVVQPLAAATSDLRAKTLEVEKEARDAGRVAVLVPAAMTGYRTAVSLADRMGV